MNRRTLKILGFVLVGLLVLIFGLRIAFARMFSTGGAPLDAIQQTTRSKDGTLIAYEQTGTGPVIVLVSAALADRDGARRLARQLAPSFTVINYDRRGRGKSANTEPYAVEREIEDLEVVVNAAGAPVFLFGSSSGAVLALDAASRLGPQIKKIFLYEPPFIVDGSRPPIPGALLQEITAALSRDRREKALALFFGKGMGIPAVGVTFMRLFLPAWKDMVKLAPTTPYDLMILAGTQSGKSLPDHRWSPAVSPTLVAVGAKSEPFFHSGARALTGVLPAAHYRALNGLDHSAVLMAPQVLANAIREFFLPAGSATHAIASSSVASMDRTPLTPDSLPSGGLIY